MGLLPLELDGAPFSAEGLQSTKRVCLLMARRSKVPFVERTVGNFESRVIRGAHEHIT